MKRIVLSSALCLLLGGLLTPLLSDERRQAILNDTLEDQDYGFRLSRPSATWGFLPEKTIRRFDGDGVAGLYHAGAATYTSVAVNSSEEDLKAYLGRVADELGLRRTQVRKSTVEDLAGRRVGRLQLTGEKNGERRSYQVSVFPGERAYFRVVSWWPGTRESTVAADIEQIHKNFQVTGKADLVEKLTADPYEMIGVGWEVRNNFYQNAILGLSATLPRKDWRFLGSLELRSLNPEAAMGMEHEKGAYLILVAEKLGEYVFTGYENTVIESLKKELKYDEHTSREVVLMDQKKTLHIFTNVRAPGVDGEAIDYGIIVSTAETYGYQWFAWWPSGARAESLAALEEVYDRFTFMDWPRQKQLREDLLKFAHRPRSVRGNENFRNLTYRNYANGTILKLPRAFWEHRLDEEEAPVANGEPQPSVRMENVTSGLYLTMRHEVCKLTPGAYHREVLKTLGEYDVLKDEVFGEAFGPVYATRVRPKQDKEFIYHIATAVRGQTCLQVSMHGYVRNLEDSYKLERQVLRGLTMSGRRFENESLDRTEFVDFRMGYRVGKLRDMTLERALKIEGLESSLVSVNGRGVALLAGAVHATIEPRDFPRDFAGQELMRGVSLEEGPVARTVEWLGQPAQLLEFRGTKDGAPTRAEILVTGVGGSNFFIFSIGQDSIPDDFKSGFRLLE